MQIESLSRDTIELLQATFAETPEALNAIHMVRIMYKFIIAVIDSMVLTVADINQTIIAAPTIAVDDPRDRE